MKHMKYRGIWSNWTCKQFPAPRQGTGWESLSSLGKVTDQEELRLEPRSLVSSILYTILTSENIKREQHVKRLNERSMFLYQKNIRRLHEEKPSLTLPLLKIKN